jgi:flagellar biosynthesis/type III secretory pathway protein FliH
MAAVEFDFEALEAVAPPPRSPADEAAAVMSALAQAEADAERLRSQAREEGFAAGRAEALEGFQPALAALAAAAEQVEAQQAAAAAELERRAVDLGLALAAKVLGGALEAEPERVVESVRGALRGIVERERIIVLVNPEDLELVRGAMDEVRASLGGIEHCEVQAERRVARGGCIVRTPVGDVDARVETKLERAREVVAAALARS